MKVDLECPNRAPSCVSKYRFRCSADFFIFESFLCILLYIHFPFQRFWFSCSVKSYGFWTPFTRPNDSESVFDRDCPSFSGKKHGKVKVPVTTPPKDLGENSLEHPLESSSSSVRLLLGCPEIEWLHLICLSQIWSNYIGYGWFRDI